MGMSIQSDYFSPPVISDLINIHCHSTDSEIFFSVFNQYVDTDLQILPPSKISGLRSLGIHPWYVNETSFEKQLACLRNELMTGNYFALGECGLDRVHGPSIDFQKEALLAQLEIAGELELPAILHLVRAYSDILEIRKQVSLSLKLIVHGFSGNLQQAKQLTDAGFYLSFGTALIRPQKKLKEAFLSCPLNQLFLETDTSSISIAEVYESASKCKGISMEELASQLKMNFDKIR